MNGLASSLWLGICGAVGVALAACAGVAPSRDDAALRSLVDAERAFAAMSVASGMRAAFAANFAVDGVAFEPAPVDASRAFFSRPEPPNAKPLTLDWAPAAAGIAASGDFGFTTGPFTLTDRASGRSLRTGVFFSVWKRDGAGPWRVALDAGITTPTLTDARALTPSPALAQARAEPQRARGEIAAIETRSVDAADYAAWFASDGRLHREGFAPMLGDARVRTHLAPAAGTALTFAAQGGGIAPSGDLAYTYGALAAMPQRPGAPESGYYVHLWAREATGGWKLVVAVVMPGT
jgi:ketosteroid isomerase-like protein